MIKPSEVKVRFYGTLPDYVYEDVKLAFSGVNAWSLDMDTVTLRNLFNHICIVPQRDSQFQKLIETTITATLRPGVARDDAQRWLGLYLDKVTGGKVLVSYATE